MTLGQPIEIGIAIGIERPGRGTRKTGRRGEGAYGVAEITAVTYPNRSESISIAISISTAFGPANILARNHPRLSAITNCGAICCAWQLTLAPEMVFLLIHLRLQQEYAHEDALPAFEDQADTQARFPRTHGHQGWSQSVSQSPQQGARAPRALVSRTEPFT